MRGARRAAPLQEARRNAAMRPAFITTLSGFDPHGGAGFVAALADGPGCPRHAASRIHCAMRADAAAVCSVNRPWTDSVRPIVVRPHRRISRWFSGVSGNS